MGSVGGAPAGFRLAAVLIAAAAAAAPRMSPHDVAISVFATARILSTASHDGQANDTSGSASKRRKRKRRKRKRRKSSGNGDARHGPRAPCRELLRRHDAGAEGLLGLGRGKGRCSGRSRSVKHLSLAFKIIVGLVELAVVLL